MDVGLTEQLAHPRVDDREAGPSGRPRREACVGERSLVVLQRRERRVQVLPGRLRRVPHHVGVEVAPHQLAAVAQRTLVGAERRVHRARVDAAVLQVGGHGGGPLRRGQVARLGVPRRGAADERLEGGERGQLAGGGQLHAAEVGVVGDAVVRQAAVGPAHRSRQYRRAPQPAGAPGAGVGRVDLVRRAVVLDERPRRHAVRRPGRDQRHVAERRPDPLVPRPAVGRRVRADVHAGGTGVARHPWHDLLRRPGQHAQPSVGALVQLAQAAVEEGQARGAGRAAQRVVEDEQRQHVVGGRLRGLQGGVVGQAQVPSEPQHGGRHADER